MRKFEWEQVGGDMDPGTYGGLIARSDGEYIELIEIQPVREYVGDREALEVGYPFWSREATFSEDEALSHPDLGAALQYVGGDLREVEPQYRALAAAEALMMYGVGVDEGPSGWAKDVVGDRRVKWWGSKRRVGWRYLADEDQEFRQLLREAG